MLPIYSTRGTLQEPSRHGDQSTDLLRLRPLRPCPSPGSVFSPGPCSGALASPAASRHRFLGGLEDSLENLSLMHQKISDIFNVQRCKSLDLWAIALLMNFVWFLDRLQLHTICPVCNFRKHFEQHHVAAAIDSEIGAPEVRSSLATPNSNLVSPNYAMILWR